MALQDHPGTSRPARAHADPMADDPAPPDPAAVRLALRRRAAQKERRASRLAVLELSGLNLEEQRREARFTVEQFRRARAWLRAAAAEARLSDELLTLDEALRRFSERHVEGVIRLGLMRDRGCTRDEIQQRLGITRDQFDVALEWWRDSLIDADHD